MSVIKIKPEHLKQSRMYNVLKNLENLPKTTVIREPDYTKIVISHEQQFVPNFTLEWCTKKEHYRVYIHVTRYETCVKTRAGYAVCTISNAFYAMGFGVLYSFLHKHRANNKET